MMNNLPLTGTYRPLPAPADVIEPVIAAPDQDREAPPAQRLLHACRNPKNILTAAQLIGVASAVVLGVGTGAGVRSHLIAGGAGMLASVATTLGIAKCTPETYRLDDRIGDNRLGAVAGFLLMGLCWVFAAIVTQPDNSGRSM